jgi:hypothetical protein
MSVDVSTGSSAGGTLGSIIGSYWGPIGSMVGGWIGSMLGAWIFGIIGGKNHKPYNNETRDINLSTKLDAVPYLIGSDICPGSIVWFGQLSLYDSAELRAQGVYSQGSSYFGSYYRPTNSKFAIAFAQKIGPYYGAGLRHNIDRLFFNTKDIWFWGLWLSDAIKMEGMLEDYNIGAGVHPIWIRKDAGYTDSTSYLLREPDPDVPYKWYNWFSYDGWFGDFSIVEDLGIDDTYNADEFNFRDAIRLTQFPDITGEVTSCFSIYAGESFKPQPSFISSVQRHSSRDGLHDYWYTFQSGFINLVNQFRFSRIHPFYGETVIANYPTTVNNVTYPMNIYDITAGWNNDMSLSRTDEWDNRIYFFHGKIVSGENHWLDTDPESKHHAQYSLKYSLFYIDREDTLNPVSLKLDEPIYGLNHFDSGNCAFVAKSMEVTRSGKILVFGQLVQDAFPLQDNLRCTQDTVAPGTRIYLDLSGYPDGWWVNKYIWESISNLSFGGKGVPRRIVAQTQTYVDIDQEMGRNPVTGAYMHLDYAQRYEQEFITVDYGSTTTHLITNYKPSLISTNRDGKFDAVVIIGYNYNVAFTIDQSESFVGGNITLTDPLPVAPVPGQNYYLVFEGSPSVAYDQDVVNPELPYDAYTDEVNDGDPWRYSDISSIGGPNICAVLQFDKETGEFEGILNKTLAPYFYSLWGLQYCCSFSDLIATCATEEEIWVYYACMQIPTCGKICQYAIDSDTLSFDHFSSGGNDTWDERGLWESNPNGCGHAWGINYHATAWLWVTNPNTGELIKQWYALRYDYPNYQIRFGRLRDNRFSSGLIKILVRETVYTGPLYNGWWFTGETFNEDMSIGKVGIENKLFIYLNHAYDGGYYSFGGYGEFWVLNAPTTLNPNGVLRCVAQSGAAWTCGYATIDWNLTSSFTTLLSGYYQGSAYSYHRDENPISALDILFKNDVFGDYFQQGSIPLIDVTSVTPATSTCNEPVTVTAVIGNNYINFLEPRYQYSLCMDARESVMDIARDIMNSCMGWIFQCGKKVRYVVPTSTETPVFSFGKESSGHLFTVQGNIPTYPQSTAYVAYNWTGKDTHFMILTLDLSAYPINYFKGESGLFTFNLITYEVIVTEHMSTTQLKIIGDSTFNLLCEDAYWHGLNISGSSFYINPKDNIKEGTFVFSQKSRLKRPNLVRVEYKDRLQEYVNEIAESQSDYLRLSDEYDKIQTYKMRGVKRSSQANRLAQQLMDYNEFVEWSCAFEADVSGLYLCPGEIITVSHEITGWNGKYFRIMSLEEVGDSFEVRLECEEYNPYVYHDQGSNLLISNSFNGFPGITNDMTPVSQFSNLNIFESREFPYLYFGFNSDVVQSNIIGGRVYRFNGTTWDVVGNIAPMPITMVLVNSLTDSIFDNSYIEYSDLSGVLPTSGLIFIGEELISYNGIDADNNRLMNIVRQQRDTYAAAHASGSLITFYEPTIFVDIASTWLGSQTFRVVPLIYSSSPMFNFNSAVSFTINIQLYGYRPYFPESLRLVEE